jgi:hypothetical protein
VAKQLSSQIQQSSLKTEISDETMSYQESLEEEKAGAGKAENVVETCQEIIKKSKLIDALNNSVANMLKLCETTKPEDFFLALDSNVFRTLSKAGEFIPGFKTEGLNQYISTTLKNQALDF